MKNVAAFAPDFGFLHISISFPVVLEKNVGCHGTEHPNRLSFSVAMYSYHLSSNLRLYSGLQRWPSVSPMVLRDKS